VPLSLRAVTSSRGCAELPLSASTWRASSLRPSLGIVRGAIEARSGWLRSTT